MQRSRREDTRDNQDRQDNEDGQPDAKVSRRAGMASIARRRAAHFAHFTADDETQQEDNVHVGGDQASTLGPWSSAVELVNARERAAQQRSDKILLQSRKEAGDDADTVPWTPARDVNLGLRPSQQVPALFDTCVDLLCEYVECVESLWGVPDAIKLRICAAVCKKRKLSPEVARLFVEHTPSEVVLDDCTQLDQPTLTELLKECCTSRLERLELGFVGRGLGDDAAKALNKVEHLRELRVLKVGGAYRITDEGAVALVSVAPNLTDLTLTQCPRLGGDLVEQLPQLTTQLRRLELTDCRGLNLECLLLALPKLKNLHAISLEGVQEVDDSVVMELAQVSTLKELNLRMCSEVGDDGIVALCARLPGLHSLTLDDCTKITDRSLEAITGAMKELQVIGLKRCFRLSDQGLAGLATLGTLRSVVLNGLSHVGPATINSITLHCSNSLEYLDIGFCRKVPEDSLGKLVDACSRLKKLLVFGCSQLSTKFYAGHSNEEVEIVGMGTLQA